MIRKLILITVIILIYEIHGRKFHDLKFEDLETESKDLHGEYAIVKSPHDLYGIPYASKDGFQCSPSIIRVSEATGISNDKTRPQIVISGEIHGDERVGPPSTLHIAQLLVWSAQCEIRKNPNYCKKLQDFSNLSKGQRLWLAMLTVRRDSFLIPAANCLGHKFRRRDDNFVDPNRDFPYSRSNGACLLSTTAKIFEKIMQNNIIQVVVTYHGGMVALGYEWGSKNHPSPHDGSPDDTANKELGNLLSQYGSSAGPGENDYKVNRINSIVYAVDGGMEDWMYAAGWDKGLVRQDCVGSKVVVKPKPKHRFLRGDLHEINHNLTAKSRILSAVKTTENNTTALSGNRALVFLVETSDAKSPHESTLGGTEQVLYPQGQENGHIPRNIRLGLMAIDLLEPYVCFSASHMESVPATIKSTIAKTMDTSKNTSDHSPNLVNNTNHKTNNAATATTTSNAATVHQSFLHIKWYVGGSHSVDKTFLTLSRAPTVPAKASGWSHYLESLPSDYVLDDVLPLPNKANNTSAIHPVNAGGKIRNAPRLISPVFTGPSRWNAASSRIKEEGSSSKYDEAVFDENDPLRPKHEFSLSLNLSRLFTHRKRKLSDPLHASGGIAQQWGSYSSSASSSVASGDHHPLDLEEDNNVSHRRNHHPRRQLLAKGQDEIPVASRTLSTPVTSAAVSTTSTTSLSMKGKYWIIAWAMVDQTYGTKGQGHPNDVGPMSYYANIRTHSDTHCATTGPDERSCQGRRYWPSDFIEIDVLEDGTIAHTRQILHCATWSMPPPSPTSLAKDTSHANSDVDSASNPISAHVQKPPPARFQPDIEDSYTFEQSYFFFLAVLAIAGFVVWHLTSYWRRNRIYASVISNKYLKLPTGFRGLSQSPSSLSSPSSTSSFSSSDIDGSTPASPAPPSMTLTTAFSLTTSSITV